MLRLILIYLLCLYGFCASLLGADSLEIHTDKAFYVSGEQMGIWNYHSNGFDGELTYVEILTQNGTLIDHILLRCDGIVSSGTFSIPTNWQSGWYMLRAYTIWMPGIQIKELDYKIIPIYNLYDPKQAQSGQISVREPALIQAAGIKLNQANYQKGDQAQIEVHSLQTPEDHQAIRFCLTIVDSISFHLAPFFESILPQIPASSLPEPLPGSQVQTRMLFLGQAQSKTLDLLGALYVDEDALFHWLNFNESGVFGLETDAFKGTKHAHLVGLEILGGIRHLKAEMFYPSDGLPFPDIDFPLLPYTPQITSYIKACYQRQVMGELFPNPSQKEGISSAPNSFSEADLSYLPKDYIRFTDTEDFIQEVATFMKIRKTPEGYWVRVMMEKNNLAAFEPLLYLNGHLLTDAEELIGLDLDQIERIDIYRKGRTIVNQFSTPGRNGVIAFYTYDRNIKPKSGNPITLKGFQPSQQILQASIPENGPAFAPRLFWQAGLKADAEGHAQFQFPITDDQGPYYLILHQLAPWERSMRQVPILLKQQP